MMNNFKYSYAKKYHYFVKYMVIALPLLVIICGCFFNLVLDGNNQNISLGYAYNPWNILKMLSDFLNSHFSWYNTLLQSIGLGFTSNNAFVLPNFLQFYPLYILLVYILDLILDILSIFFKLIHKFINKVVKDYD